MARRYEDIQTQKTLSGKVAYLPTIYPSVTLSNEDYYIIAREQDRMDLLANDFSPEIAQLLLPIEYSSLI